jgi:hypothetical protein
MCVLKGFAKTATKLLLRRCARGDYLWQKIFLPSNASDSPPVEQRPQEASQQMVNWRHGETVNGRKSIGPRGIYNDQWLPKIFFKPVVTRSSIAERSGLRSWTV